MRRTFCSYLGRILLLLIDINDRLEVDSVDPPKHDLEHHGRKELSEHEASPRFAGARNGHEPSADHENHPVPSGGDSSLSGQENLHHVTSDASSPHNGHENHSHTYRGSSSHSGRRTSNGRGRHHRRNGPNSSRRGRKPSPGNEHHPVTKGHSSSENGREPSADKGKFIATLQSASKSMKEMKMVVDDRETAASSLPAKAIIHEKESHVAVGENLQTNDPEASNRINPFERKPTMSSAGSINGDTNREVPPAFTRQMSASHDARFRQEIVDTLKTLAEDATDFQLCEHIAEDESDVLHVPVDQNTPLGDVLLQKASDIFAQRWKLKDEMSEVAFRGLLLVLEQCLSSELKNHASFAYFIDLLGFHTVFFWKKAVPFLYESDMRFGTNYRDALLFSLTLYDVNSGKSRLRELFAAVPGLRDSLLGKPAKRFEEAFSTMMQRRLSCSSQSSPAAAAQTIGRQLSASLRKAGSSSSNLLLDHIRSRLADEDVTNGHGKPAAEDEEVAKVMSQRDSFQRQHSSTSGASSTTGASSVGSAGGAENNGNNLAPGQGGQTEGRSSGHGSTCFSPPPLSMEPPDTIVTGGLTTGHFQERVIAVSNAPPVSLRKRQSSWEIGQGSGGLVSCCAPVMNKDPENIWLACFGPGVPLNRAAGGGRCESPSLQPMPTNSLGIPLIKTANSEVHFSLLQEPNKEDDGVRQEIKDTLSLLNVLKNYNKDNYKLNPVVVQEEDYNTYYGGISNGLLWPALHNLPEYIVDDYDDNSVLLEHWNAYVRVNYQFAINAARNSRSQDFLWIHDYHLMLTGAMLQSLDANLETGFFLHIPFQPPEIFFTKYKVVAEAVLRGILSYNKVGFQTHRDRGTFVELVCEHFPNTKVEYHQASDKHKLIYDGMTSSLGVFPVSIKNEEFLDIVNDPKSLEKATDIRKRMLGDRVGKFFFSVERFDYTKGIKEKLQAYKRYYERHPDRIGKDVFLQVAVTNRRSVETYRHYQDECEQLAKDINEQFRNESYGNWTPLIFQTEGLVRTDLIPHYMAMDVGVVTPKKDGMNLVAKEMLICNPKAGLVLSTGAGTEQQFSSAGFYNENEKLYYRVANIYDRDEFADVFYEAALDDRSVVSSKSQRLSEFLLANDIEKWSQEFLDPSWTHDVIRVSQLHSLNDFYALMYETRHVRRQIVERVLKGSTLRPQFALSLRNARITLKDNAREGTNILWLRTTTEDGSDHESKDEPLRKPRKEEIAKLDVSDEIRQLDIDLAFLEHVQSQDYDNLERFMASLANYHQDGADAFASEIDAVITLICKGDHFQYFFTDRDGTLKSYSCSYQSSIQGAYSGVIQATFAQRCTQYAAIVTTAPLSNIGILDVLTMPDGYYCYGASAGREWYVDGSRKFKDDSINGADLELLDRLAEEIQALLEKPKYHHFAWIGSGFQKHYGHITVARQDCYGSVDEEKSAAWYQVIADLVNEVDPMGKTLHVHDSETDIKIFLKAKLSGNVFTKGHGIGLFANRMGLDLTDGNILIFGDSETDLPMLEEALSQNPENTYAVWVTANEELRDRVTQLCRHVNNTNFAFVTSPEVVLGAMAQATVREIKIRPQPEAMQRRHNDSD